MAEFKVLVVKDSLEGMRVISQDLDNPVGIDQMLLKKIRVGLRIVEDDGWNLARVLGQRHSLGQVLWHAIKIIIHSIKLINKTR